MLHVQFPWENSNHCIWKDWVRWMLYPGKWVISEPGKVQFIESADRRYITPNRWQPCLSCSQIQHKTIRGTPWMEFLWVSYHYREATGVCTGNEDHTHFLLPYSIASTPSFIYIPFRQWYDWPNQTVLHDNEVHYPPANKEQFLFPYQSTRNEMMNILTCKQIAFKKISAVSN